MGDHHDHDHDNEGVGTFVASPLRQSIGVVAALLAYAISSFSYEEVDCRELCKRSLAGQQVKWTTFDNHFFSNPVKFVQPEDKTELMAVVKDAVASVRVVGSGHSWSPLGLTDGVMVNLDRLNKVIEIDADRKTVTVEAGIRIRDLSQRLAEHDPPLALANTGVLNRQSLAGALATGTHGTGVRQPIMSAHIDAVEILTSDGQLVFVSSEDGGDEDAKDVLDAARVHLGALGIVTVLRLRVIDTFSVIKRSRVLSLDDFLMGMKAQAEATDHVLAWWLPYTNSVQVLESNRTAYGERPPNQGSEPAWQSWWPKLHHLLSLGKVQMRLLCAVAYVSAHFPLYLVPYFNRYLTSPIFNGLAGTGGTVFVQQGHVGLVLDDHPDEYREQEWFIHSSNFTAAWKEFQDFLSLGKGHLGANFVVQFRFTAADDILLSPLSGDEGSYYVAIAMLMKGIDCEPYFRGASRIMLAYGGRPHWAKVHYLEHEELESLYGPRLEKFDKIRRKLDPHGVFMNPYLTTLLLPKTVA